MSSLHVLLGRPMKNLSSRRLSLLSFVFVLAACSSGIQRDPPIIEDIAALAVTLSSTTVQVSDAFDDAEETNSSGAVTLANTALTFGAKAGAAQTVGLRFQNVAIPKGATITGAVLEVKAAAATTTAATFTVKGELADSAFGYTNVARALSSRTKTVASAAWTPTAWTTGAVYRSSSLTTLVQEIVGRPGWFQGNTLALQLTGTGTRSAVAFNGTPASAPKLIVNYTYDAAVSPVFLNRSVGAATDDAEQPGMAATVTVSTVLELGVNGTTAQAVGMRFPNLTIPPGARIDSALLEVTASAADAAATNYTIAGEASDSALPFTTATNSISGRVKISSPALAPWRPSAFAANTNYRTVSVSPHLQAIINRPGWRSGNAAAFILSGTGARRVFAFDGGAARAPRLVVSYTPGVVTPPPPTNPCSTLSGTLPSPWTGGDVGTVSAAGKAGSASGVFDLCGYGGGLGTTTDSLHFVRQTLTGDGTLTARVVTLDATTPQAEAGLMIRETLDPGAKYAAVTIAGAGQTAFSTRGGTAPTALSASPSVTGILLGVANGVVPSSTGSASDMLSTVQGVAAEPGTLTPQAAQLTAPYWLRITRVGTALSGYVSADGQTWQAAGKTTLALAQPVFVGLSVTSKGNAAPATARFDSVTLGPVINDNCEYLFDSTLPPSNTGVCEFNNSGQVKPGGGLVRTSTASGTAFVQVYPQFLQTAAPITVAATPRPTGFPGEFATSYPANELTEVGDAVKVTIPGSALNFASENNFIGIYAPPNSAYSSAANNIYELHISSSALSEPFLYFDYYSAEEAVAIRTDLLKALFGGTATGDIIIVIQPVSIDAGTAQGQQLSTQNVVYANYIEGLYSISDDDSFAAIFDDACPSGPGTARQSVPSVASEAISLEEGKTPLVLVHGWQGFGSVQTLKGTFFPGLCTWPNFAKNFMQSENTVLKSSGLDMLKEKYQLFVFSYDSSEGVVENATKLREKLAAFGSTPAVVLAHSMGGIVSNAALNAGAPIKHLITLGTPFRGSPALVCIEASATQCDQARLNRDVLIKALNLRTGIFEDFRRFAAALQFRILQGQGGKDLSWEYPGYIGQPNSPTDLTLTICRVLNRICQSDYYFGGKGNPKLSALNEASEFSKHTSYYGAGSDIDGVVKRFSQALQDATGHQNDLIVPIQSACASAQMNDCAGSKFKGLMAYPKLGHEDIKEDEGILASVTAQLLRLASDSYAYDIDDGTPDGNQRLLIGTISSPGVADDASEIDGVVDMLPQDESLEYSGTDFGFIFGDERYGEDADQNEVYGDGRISMEDFRRWRDWALKSEGKGFFDGSSQHVKRNMDGGGDNVFPRWGDFNGDGKASSSLRFQVPYIPGTDGNPTTETLSDLEVMMRVAEKKNLWRDDYYRLADLPGLVDSGDIELFVRDLFNLPKAATVTSRIQEVQASNRPLTREEPRQVYTLEPGTYHAVIEVLDSEGFLILGLQKQFEVQRGSDNLWGPTAKLIPQVKKTYDGPIEDCPRLQGVFTIDIKGLFQEPAPTIPIDDQHAVMAIDRELIEIYEREDVSPPGQKPLIVEAATIRNCNLLEEEFELGFLSTYFDATDTGYTAYVGDTFTNIDNRWEILAWNRTGVGDPAFCSAFDIDYSLTYLDGRPTEPQVLANIAPLQNRPFLARYETLYKETYQNSETGDILVEGAFEVPFIDEKAALFGVEAWGHSVVYEPGCDVGPPAGRLQPQEDVMEEPAPGSQVFEAAEAPWLERQAPRSGEFGW